MLVVAGVFFDNFPDHPKNLERCISTLAAPRGAVEIAAQACSVGLAGELDSAAQASCEKAIRKRCARVATRSEHLALFVYPPSMDMLGSALQYGEGRL